MGAAKQLERQDGTAPIAAMGRNSRQRLQDGRAGGGLGPGLRLPPSRILGRFRAPAGGGQQ